jgi:hypothetical protein
MTTASGVAVVATQLAQTDRRALSQAWYSALHLADASAPPRRSRAAQSTAAPSTAHALEEQAPAAGVRSAAPMRPAAVPSGTREQRFAAASERRCAPSAAARRVERAVERIARAPHRTGAQTIAIDGGRVRLLVRSDRGATRIVALCSEPLRAGVERALAHARFALAARGHAVTVR